MNISYGQGGSQTGAGPAAELLDRIRAATEATPYRVDMTQDGFQVAADLPNRHWHGLMYRRMTEQTFVHSVRVDEQARKLSITDTAYTVVWEADASGPVPRLGAEASVESGRVAEVSFQKTVGGQQDEHDFSFASEEGRRLITEPAKQLGWQIAWGRNAVIGLVVAGAAVGLVVLVLIILGILALTGTL